jgi:hypothetical protein
MIAARKRLQEEFRRVQNLFGEAVMFVDSCEALANKVRAAKSRRRGLRRTPEEIANGRQQAKQLSRKCQEIHANLLELVTLLCWVDPLV